MPTLTQDQLALDITLPFDGLVSYHYYRHDDAMSQVTHHGNLRLIADSGAFSAFTQGSKIELAEYAAWLTRWRPHLYWAASLDVFGDPAATLANFRALRDRHGLDTVPTLHIGTDPTHLDVYATEGVDFVALGGMVGMPKPNVVRWLVHMARYARDHHPQMRFHGWGMSSQSILDAVPLYSVDSSGLLTQAYRYGTLSLWHPRRRRMVKIDLNGRDPYRHRPLLMGEYNVPPAIIDRSVPARNKHLLVRLAGRSTQLRSTYLAARHRLSAPQWAINPAQGQDLTGTRMHAVLDTTDFRRICTPLHEGDPIK